MHYTDMVPPTAHVSLHDCLLMLHLQVTLFTQCHFNKELLVCSPGHFQQFRQCLIEPATIHTQWCSQNLAKLTPPPFYCGNIVVLVIVLYCIMIVVVSCLICLVTGTTSHMTLRMAQLLGQVACLYSSLFSHSTSLLMCT